MAPALSSRDIRNLQAPAVHEYNQRFANEVCKLQGKDQDPLAESFDQKPHGNVNMASKKIAFVAMPFGTKETGIQASTEAPSEVDFDELWNLAYYPALEEAGYLPVRADAQEGSLIIQDMIAQLMLADLVVADISIPNANVYYQKGLRHGGGTQGCNPSDAQADRSKTGRHWPKRTESAQTHRVITIYTAAFGASRVGHSR